MHCVDERSSVDARLRDCLQVVNEAGGHVSSWQTPGGKAECADCVRFHSCSFRWTATYLAVFHKCDPVALAHTFQPGDILDVFIFWDAVVLGQGDQPEDPLRAGGQGPGFGRGFDRRIGQAARRDATRTASSSSIWGTPNSSESVVKSSPAQNRSRTSVTRARP